MCFPSVQTPEPIEVEKPVFVRNPFLDDEDTKARSADALRRGRSSLVIPTGTGIGFQGAGSSSQQSAGGSSGGVIDRRTGRSGGVIVGVGQRGDQGDGGGGGDSNDSTIIRPL